MKFTGFLQTPLQRQKSEHLILFTPHGQILFLANFPTHGDEKSSGKLAEMMVDIYLSSSSNSNHVNLLETILYAANSF